MAAETLLALWNDTATRSPGFVAPAERVTDEAIVKHYHGDDAEDALDRAKTHGWTVVSMKEDWSAVFVSA